MMRFRHIGSVNHFLKTPRVVFLYINNMLHQDCEKLNCYLRFNDFNGRHLQRLSVVKNASVSFRNYSTVGDILEKWTKTFANNSILEPEESIQFILCHQLNIERISDIYKKHWSNHILTNEDIDNINSMCQKRLQKFPVQYILGKWTFRDLELLMKPPVFIPRPETEELVEIVKNDIISTDANNVVEICCGSGAICLSLLKEIPNLSVIAVDKSKEACLLTIENSFKNKISEGLTVLQHEIISGHEIVGIFAGKENYFDIIVSNPPYVLTKDMKELQPEIKLYEDLTALDGGPDGMAIIKPILRLSSVILRSCGRLYLEVDPSHPDIIRSLLHSKESERGEKQGDNLRNCGNLGLRVRKIHEDFNKKARFVEIIKCCEFNRI